MTSTLFRILALLFSAFLSFSCFAAGYPQRPVTLIVPFAPGGGADAMARTFASYMNERLGQPVVVLNRPGASGRIGFTAIAQAPADGYTIGVVTVPNLVVMPTQSKAPYQLTDFALIGNLVEDIGMFVVRKDSPLNTVADLVERAKADPGKVTVATTGPGSLPHLSVLSLEKEANVKLTAVTYTGAAPIKLAVLAGDVDVGIVTIVDGQGEIYGGTFRSLGITSEGARSALLEGTPSFREQGFNVVSIALRGFAAPAATPPAILKTLRDVLKEATQDPAFVGAAKKQSMPLRYLDADALHAEIGKQHQQYQSLWEASRK